MYPGHALPDSYKNMILAKWMRSLKYGNDYFKLTDSDAYFGAYERYINSLLKRANLVIRLAALTQEKDVVLGWSAIEGTTLHYVWVQREQRNQKIGTALVPTKISTISHLTKAGMSIWHSKLSHAVFDPFC